MRILFEAIVLALPRMPMGRKALALGLRDARKHSHLQHVHVREDVRLAHDWAPAVAAEEPFDAFAASSIVVLVDLQCRVLVLVRHLLLFNGHV